MAIPVIDFSKLEGKERAETLARIDNGCEQWGFFQLVNHGIPVELLERVKKVSTECYRHRAEAFKSSRPVQLLDQLVREEEVVAGEDVNNKKKKLDDVDFIECNNNQNTQVIAMSRNYKNFGIKLQLCWCVKLWY